MSKEWIIDVLGDVRGFATANGLPTLADQLEEAIAVAAIEIAQITPGQAGLDGAEVGRHVGTAV